MLPNSAVIYYNPNTARVEIRDKYLVNLEFDFAPPNNETIADWIYDDERQILWMITTSSFIYRLLIEYDVGTGYTVTQDQNIAIPYNTAGTGVHMQILQSTGDVYFVAYQNHVPYIYKVLVDGDIIDSSITLPAPAYLASSQGTNYVSISIDQQTGAILILVYWYVYDDVSSNSYGTIRWANLDKKYPTSYGIDANLTQWDYVGCIRYFCRQGQANLNTPISYIDVKNLWSNDGEIEYNPISYVTICGSNVNQYYIGQFKSINSYRYSIGQFKIPSLNDSITRPCVRVGHKSGNTYIFNADRYVILDINFDVIFEKTFTDFSSNYIYMNKYSEEIYRQDSSNVIHIYDRWGEKIYDTEHLSFPTSVQKLIIMAGTELFTPMDITPNVVILPNKNSRSSDVTPTFIFRVGVSPAGWIQQFRVILDRNPEKIANATIYDEDFERIGESYVLGDYYKNWNWKYSKDWDEVTGSYNTGTWEDIGTGIGSKTGGVEPDNGVISPTHSSRYVRFTLANADELVGAATEDVWYLKIFSICT